MGKRPLCEGVVVRPGRNSQECWLVSHVQVAKCKKEAGFTFYHLTTHSDFAVLQLFGSAPSTSTVLGSVVAVLIFCSAVAAASLFRSRLLRSRAGSSDITAQMAEDAVTKEEMTL